MLGYLDRMALVAGALIIAGVAWSGVLPQIEARLFPVVGKLDFEEIEWKWDDRDKTAVMVSFTKRRACDFKALAWYVDDRWVRVDFDVAAGTRPPGDNRAGPWVIHSPTLENSRVLVRHRCHPLYDIWTTLYP